MRDILSCLRGIYIYFFFLGKLVPTMVDYLILFLVNNRRRHRRRRRRFHYICARKIRVVFNLNSYIYPAALSAAARVHVYKRKCFHD